MQRKITKSYSLFVAESFWNAEKGYADKTNKRQIGCIKSADGNGECIFNERFLKERPEFLKWRFFRVGKGKYEFERRNADEIKQELQFEESLKQRLEFICEFSKVTPTFINGSIRKIEKTNLSYIEPHKVIIKNITFLVFNYSNDVYISNLTKKIKLSELEEYIKNI